MRIDDLSAASFSVLRRNFESARFSRKNFAVSVRDYVDNLIAQFGLRKCGFAGQKICRETLKYLSSE